LELILPNIFAPILFRRTADNGREASNLIMSDHNARETRDLPECKVYPDGCPSPCILEKPLQGRETLLEWRY